ncbi:hypothetical protein KAFR_0J01260 [Kazachstania africana CBS 2517]|uniref:RRM domain-containing protein n=1 Tax=Kazachstania africana (strain ATCC 22294 / BCRC 22015 / CBS 2517 / CECT 1963 / NBRC 1671 / NRRL Y-8276) TaxID=1071382 RepID=H2B0P3_KAZAF|nr:hypothetical protein KAFR_0J01260 [Kazachstania africana CBS 2517]CCF60193.1 hypothetical protein KAFR_0J01260 [Kazachstania africana CBS 2517]
MSDQQPSETVVPVENVIPASAKEGGRETSDKVLYIGNLDKSINEDALKQYFQVAGQIVDVKVMVDKKNNHVNYAFIEYSTNHDANVALQTLNGIQIENKNIKINWAFQSQTNLNDDTSFNLFIGDLNVNVDDTTLANAFKSCPGFLQAHVMWDMQTSRSRGYGFVSFDTHENAQAAMDQMQGHEINGRAIRINWATKRENMNNNSNNNTNNNNNNNQVRNRMMMEGQQNMPPPPPPMGSLPPVNPQAVEDMIRRAPPRVTTAYIGNIPHFATEPDLIPLLQNFGFILDFTHYPEKGCCFIKYDTHEQAAVCIVALSNFQFQGRNLRTGWGKERSTFIPPQGMMPPPMMTSEGEQQQQQQQLQPSE